MPARNPGERGSHFEDFTPFNFSGLGVGRVILSLGVEYQPLCQVGESIYLPELILITMIRQGSERMKITEEERMKALSVLPADVRDAYLDVTRHHRRLLERLAQR